MSTRFDVVRGAEPLVTAALEYCAAGRRLPNGDSVRRNEQRLTALVQEAWRFAALLTGLEPGEMPKSWRPVSDEPEERTA